MIPYLIIWALSLVISYIYMRVGGNRLPFDTNLALPEGTSGLLLLLGLSIAIANLAADSSVSYSLACVYHKKDCKTFEGFSVYGWKFVGFYLLLSITFFLVFVLFKIDYTTLNGNLIFNYTIFIFSNFVTSLGIVTMVVDNINPIAAISKGFSFLVDKFRFIFLPLLTFFSISFAIDKMFGSIQGIYPSIFITGIASLVSFIIAIWIKSFVTLLYFKHANHLQSSTDDVNNNTIVLDQ